jgi:large subunit ribosomal protein L29|tara:strand:- start:251 stop:454 length:204 start_codon:yes stop_codon:yes gene_type:complete
MNNSEIRALNLNDLRNKLLDEKENLSKLKFSHSVTPIENPSKISKSRKLIAKIITEINYKKIKNKND